MPHLRIIKQYFPPIKDDVLRSTDSMQSKKTYATKYLVVNRYGFTQWGTRISISLLGFN